MAENRRSDRKNETGVGSVVFFKRMIALALAIIVLALAFPAVYYARAYRRAARPDRRLHAHTANDADKAAALFGSGVSAVCTGVLDPADLEE